MGCGLSSQAIGTGDTIMQATRWGPHMDVFSRVPHAPRVLLGSMGGRSPTHPQSGPTPSSKHAHAGAVIFCCQETQAPCASSSSCRAALQRCDEQRHQLSNTITTLKNEFTAMMVQVG